MATREERAIRRHQRPAPVIRGSNRGTYLKGVKQSKGKKNSRKTPLDATIVQGGQDEQASQIPGASTQGAFDAEPTQIMRSDPGDEDPNFGEDISVAVAQIGGSIEYLPAVDLTTTDGSVPDLEGGEADPGLDQEDEYLVIIRLVTGGTSLGWEDTLLISLDQEINIQTILLGISDQWSSQRVARKQLEIAFDATTEVYCATDLIQLEELDVENMCAYGLLHESSPDDCIFLESSLELEDFCESRGCPAETRCIGLYLEVIDSPAEDDEGMNGLVNPLGFRLIKELDKQCYKSLRFWNRQAATGEYGKAYRKYRIIIIASQLAKTLSFTPIDASTTRTVELNGQEITITLSQMWELIKQASGAGGSFKTFKNDLSTVNVAKSQVHRLETEMEQRYLTPLEEERLAVLNLMLQTDRLLPRSSLSRQFPHVLELRVNEMSARDFILYSRGEK